MRRTIPTSTAAASLLLTGSTGGSDTGTAGPTGGTTAGPTSADTTGIDTTASTEETSGDTTGGGGDPYSAGCDDPSRCTTYHIGPVDDSCPHEVDGVQTSACDFVGTYALRVAMGTLEVAGEGGLVIMHDNNGVTTSYAGSIDIDGGTTLRAADGQSPSAVRVYSEGSEGTLRLRGDSVHLQGFTLVCRSGGQHAITVREDLDLQGSETGGHLIENLVIAATRPENVGSNSIEQVFQSVGRETVIRNNHIWGYFEGTVDLRFASDSIFSHNTVLYYQQATSESALFNAVQVDRLEISNNIFASLTLPVASLVAADDSTEDLVVVGNALEGVSVALSGVEPTAPGVTVDDNPVGSLALESPRNPLPLADASLVAHDLGSAWGTSLDGVELSGASERLRGAYQERSPLSLPRRAVITVGEITCGGTPCTISQSIDNELQRATWTAWPGSTIEIYPSTTPYAGPMIITWPVQVRGMGSQPEDVVIRETLEDSILTNDGMWYGSNAQVMLTRSMSDPTLVEMITIEASTEERGIQHEGSAGVLLEGLHEIRRVVLRDDGDLGDGPADEALVIGSDVLVHDVLVHGPYDTCVRFGPRSWSSQATPVTTNSYVHHITCRLIMPDNDSTPINAFEVASINGVIIADAVVDLVEPGPVFRAQRRSSETDPMLPALDPPQSFIADSITVRGQGSLYDGFDDMDGMYTINLVDLLLPADPLFVGVSDSHLDPLAIGIDAGVDPNLLDPILSLAVSVDGIDRAMHVPDRGAYEQGM